MGEAWGIWFCANIPLVGLAQLYSGWKKGMEEYLKEDRKEGKKEGGRRSKVGRRDERRKGGRVRERGTPQFSFI